MNACRLVLSSLLAGAALAQGAFDDVLEQLHATASAAQVEAMRRFAARDDAPAAIPALLDRIRAEAPRLDNNGCLLLEWILRAHPEADCPLDVLLEVLARPIWNSRQKAAQALALALRPEVVARREEPLARAVIPLLTSQRSRVFEAGALCLAHIAGRELGTDPIAARRWFHERFDKGIDLLAAVHELVLVVHEAEGGFVVQGRRLPDLAALTDTVRAARERAEVHGLEVGAVLQLPAERVSRLLEGHGLDDVEPVLRAVAAAGVASATVAPDTDVFREPFAEPEEPVAALRARLQAKLDALRPEAVPGAQAAVVLPDGCTIGFTSGVADRELRTPMPGDGRLLAGSTGKTFFAALALQLVREGRLDLDAKLASFLGGEPWFARVPNAAEVTLRQLMQHRSGIMRYELSRGFLRALNAEPDHLFTPVEEVAFVLDKEPRFAAGEGFEYADTNYVLLGLVLERVTGKPNLDEIRRRFLVPLGLRDTVPGVGRAVPGLVQCYAGEHNPFGGRDAMLADGRLPFDPGFEGAGGGFASTAMDLARWAKALYEGDVLASVRDEALAGLPAPLGPGASYGLGVMIDRTALGEAWGHSGFFPGSLTVMRYFPAPKVAVAVMVNSSTEPRLSGELVHWATEFARIAAGD
ncbi:MAG TPA: serine hydrolase domain-containing protein [Planctomycetota bacterium]|nr:serine hydrolase domain-containing protein [Planctomycetota bacterium]